LSEINRKDEVSIRLQAIERLRNIIDPELGVNIIDLGLIYQMHMQDNTFVFIYTVTTPGCPVRRYLQRQIEEALQSIDELCSYSIKLVFEPEWKVEMIKEGIDFFSFPPPVFSGE